MAENTHRLTRAIHWVMAALVLFMLGLGLLMTYFELYKYYPLHKSLGIIACLAVIFRVYWRLRHPWRSSATGSASARVVHFVHWGLLLLLMLMPVFGLMFSGFGGYGVELFGLVLIPHNYDASWAAIPFHAGLASFGQLAHQVAGYTLCGFVALHIAAALKHHFIEKDDTLRRMLGKTRD